jgi:hypothetical protein
MWVQNFPRMLAFYRDTLGLPGSAIHPGAGYTPGQDWTRLLKRPAVQSTHGRPELSHLLLPIGCTMIQKAVVL